jgi:hypothetical protein
MQKIRVVFDDLQTKKAHTRAVFWIIVLFLLIDGKASA